MELVTIGAPLVIPTIQMVTGKIGSLYHTLSRHPGDEQYRFIRMKLEELDLATKLPIFERSIKDMPFHTPPPEGGSPYYYRNGAIELALNGLHEVLSNLHMEMETLDNILQNHYKKWFASWRIVDSANILERICHYERVLDKRWKLFCQLVQVEAILTR